MSNQTNVYAHPGESNAFGDQKARGAGVLLVFVKRFRYSGLPKTFEVDPSGHPTGRKKEDRQNKFLQCINKKHYRVAAPRPRRRQAI